MIPYNTVFKKKIIIIVRLKLLLTFIRYFIVHTDNYATPARAQIRTSIDIYLLFSCNVDCVLPGGSITLCC